MNPDKREQIRRTLKSLAEAQASTIQLTEQAVALFSDELSAPLRNVEVPLDNNWPFHGSPVYPMNREYKP